MANLILEKGLNWFLLIIGGDSHIDSLQNSVTELKTIWDTLISKNLVNKQQIKLLNTRNENLFGDETTLKLVTPELIISILEGKYPISNDKNPSFVSKLDTVVIFFAGHGKSPLDWTIIPPSCGEYEDLGSWMLFSDFNEAPELFTPSKWGEVQTESRIIVFSLACYSGNLFKQSFVDKNNCLAVCFATQDYPASFDQLMGRGIRHFFEQENVKERKLGDLCDKLQEFLLDNDIILLKKKENLAQTELDYNREIIESKEFAIGELQCYEPRKIPSELWGIFREIDEMKHTINELKIANISSDIISKFDKHIDVLNWRRFDLMRMYKHKPNNRIQICGNIYLLQSVRMDDLFNL
ncbi:hypothetical protein LOD99_12258 [Oopsacas minuta]|uniref:Uncharacterized protein n=1 Tax=Oopsacas minuta TaxID=111878 RepID=A0AAV7JFU6_9METZ|nr:hypothetical protein LOD99_12258 [Oopsacas minuta]